MFELIYLGIGSNIGDRETNIFSAIAALDVRDDIKVVRTASIYESDPLYNLEQPKFLNTVVELKSTLDPEVMLQVCQGVELMLGRSTDHKKNDPRVIDLDNLKIPHPDLITRKFVLVPWNEITPDFMVQDFGRTVSELLKICPDTSNVMNYKLEKTA